MAMRHIDVHAHAVGIGDVAIKRALGVPDAVFARGYQVLPVARSLERLGRGRRAGA